MDVTTAPAASRSVQLAVADGDFAEAQFLLSYVTSYLCDHRDGALVSIAPDVSAAASRSTATMSRTWSAQARSR